MLVTHQQPENEIHTVVWPDADVGSSLNARVQREVAAHFVLCDTCFAEYLAGLLNDPKAASARTLRSRKRKGASRRRPAAEVATCLHRLDRTQRRK